MDRQTGEATAADLLTKELGLLDNLMYRNRNQHGGAKYYKKLEEVRRGFRDIKVTELVGLMSTVREQLLQLQTRRTPDGIAILSRQGGALGAAVLQLCNTCDHCVSCSRLLTHEIAQRYFLNLFVVWLACLARLHALSRHMALLCHKLYMVVNSELPEQAKDQRVTDVSGGVERSLSLETDQAVQLAAAAAKAAVEGEVDMDDLGEAFSVQRPAAPTEVVPGSVADARKASGVAAAGKPALSAQASKLAAGKVPPQKAQPKAILANAYSSSEEDEEPTGKAKHKRKAKAVDVLLLPFFIDRGGEIEEIPVAGPMPDNEAPVTGGGASATEEQGDSSEGDGEAEEEGKGQGEGAAKKKRNRRKKKRQKQALVTERRDAPPVATNVQSMDVSVQEAPAPSGKAPPESNTLPRKQSAGKVVQAEKVKKTVAPSKPKQKRKLDDIDKIFAASKKKG